MKRWPSMLAAVVVLLGLATPLWAYEVVVLPGNEAVIEWLKAENWWGQEKKGEQLQVPRIMVTGISERWQKNAANMPVSQKKGVFYRLMLPLAMHANEMVLDRREKMKKMDAVLAGGGKLSAEGLAWLRGTAVVLRIEKREKADKLSDPAELRKVIDKALYKLDVIPAGLVLGQAAYESGYGTSRFAAKGNALFGQWTYGGKGLVPEQQRKELGDHRIAAYDWPFDSVRGYFINLSSHPAYEDFRRLRADMRVAGKPLGCMELAQGLKSYSERGQEYVDTLRGIIRVNNLAIADNAVFRDEPMRFLLTTADEDSAAKLRKDIEAMQKSGEIEKIVKRMRLE
ncbi:MAG: glucosaminidase domain-containing protein [Thermodesulfobacteriota bacterium]